MFNKKSKTAPQLLVNESNYLELKKFTPTGAELGAEEVSRIAASIKHQGFSPYPIVRDALGTVVMGRSRCLALVLLFERKHITGDVYINYTTVNDAKDVQSSYDWLEKFNGDSLDLNLNNRTAEQHDHIREECREITGNCLESAAPIVLPIASF